MSVGEVPFGVSSGFDLADHLFEVTRPNVPQAGMVTLDLVRTATGRTVSSRQHHVRAEGPYLPLQTVISTQLLDRAFCLHFEPDPSTTDGWRGSWELWNYVTDERQLIRRFGAASKVT